MTTQHKDVNHALLAAKQEFKPLQKTGRNPHFKNEYSTLDDIRDATLEALTRHGVIVVHRSEVKDEYTILITTVIHAETGTSLYAEFFVDNDAPQKMGSAMTYGRRYNIVNLLDLIADVDDDAESYYDRTKPETTTTTKRGLGGGKVR
jgi:hypothetical protein